MALLITSIEAGNLTDLHIGAEHAWKGGSDGVELRLDEYGGDPVELAEYLRGRRDRVWILTCRSCGEGGRSRATASERGALLAAACRGTGAYVDFEYRDWQDAGPLRKALAAGRLPAPDGLPAADGLPPAGGSREAIAPRLILSRHSFDEVPREPDQTIREMLAVEEVAAAKLAYHADTICDSFAALDLMCRYRDRVTAICMGEAGLWTRILAAKLGAFCTYCSVAPGAGTAPGQLSLGEMRERYRWADIDSATQVYGVIGDPVSHSMSPRLFNHWFAAHDINAIYLPLWVEKDHDGLARFLDGCVARPWLDIGGFSVTVPHKAAALRWVGSGADRLAQSIGAVNTLVFTDGTCRGYNTDSQAAMASLTDAPGGNADELSGLTVDVLGCGGAARAVVAGLRLHGGDVTIYARSQEKARELADRFDCRAKPWEDRTERNGAVVVNATNVGMWPDVDDSPMPTGALDDCRLVFDLVYNPIETRLLKQAGAAGATTLSGLDMFVRQAAMQFELWTSTRPDRSEGRKLLERHLTSPEARHP